MNNTDEIIDTAIAKARYMAKQYKAGTFARGGEVKEHYLDTLANEIEKLYRVNAALQAGRCDTCGADIIDNCPRCGAPQCCPQCCKIEALQAEVNWLTESYPDIRAEYLGL